MRRFYTIITILCVFSVFHLMGQMSQAAQVYISEVMFDSPLQEDKYVAGEHNNGEYIKLFNPTDKVIDLSGWILTGQGTNEQYVFPPLTYLPSGQILLIAYRSGSTFNFFDFYHIPATTPLLYQNSIILFNKGEQIVLYNAKSQLVDAFSYTGNLQGLAPVSLYAKNRPGITYNQIKSLHRKQITYKNGSTYSLGNDDLYADLATPAQVENATTNNTITPGVPIVVDPSQSSIAAVVGSMPGQFAVSPSGAATYTIPIECPAGINGMQPNISLVYNSQGGNGPLGIGFAISGLSTISRTTKNLYTDGVAAGMTFTSADIFAIDGNRLIWDGTKYVTEQRTYSLINSVGTIPTTDCPQSFKVTNKDGQTIEYGTTPESRLTLVGASVPMQWFISKTTDANGNFMTFTYQSQGGQTVIKQIDYTGNGNKLPFVSVVFNYTNKTAINKSYISGYSMEDRFLLNNIHVKSNGTLLKQYDLEYDYKTDKEKYFLKSVGLVGQNNEKLNNTVVEWGSDNTAIATLKVDCEKVYPSLIEDSNHNYTSCDFDGDGKSDLVDFYTGKELGQYYNFVRILKYKSDQHTMSDQGSYPFEPNIISIDDSFKSVMEDGLFADFNGDGKKTIVCPFFVDVFSKGMKYIDPISHNYIAHSFENGNEPAAYTMGDINNDGKDELISIEKSSSSTNYFLGKIFLRKNTTQVALPPDPNSPLMIRNPDTNGSGNNGNNDNRTNDPSLDIPYYQNDMVEVPFSPSAEDLANDPPQKLFIVDFNSDGLKDILVLTRGGCFFYKNNGGVKDANGVIVPSFSYVTKTNDFNSEFSRIRLGDFNGDGLIDLILNEHCNSHWKLAINKGNSTFEYIPLSNITAQKEDIPNYINNIEDCIVTDINHDGKSDVIIVDIIYDTHLVTPKGQNSYTSYTYNKTDIKWFVSDGQHLNQYRQYDTTDQNFTFNRYSTTGDFDGDGREDLLTFGSDLYGGQTKMDNTIFINNGFNTNFEANQVKSVTDGLGNKTTINYQPLSNTKKSDGSDFYTKGTTATYPVADIQAPLYCVASVSQQTGVGDGVSKSEYSYAEAKVHVTGKGFLGFKSQTVSNALSNTQTTSTTVLDANYMPSTQTTETSIITGTDKKVSKTELTFENTLTNKIYETKPKKTVETDYLKGLTKTTENLEWDTNGNLKKMKTTQGDLTETKEIIYGQFGSWAWCDNKPKTVTTTREQGTETPYKRVMGYNYDATTGNLLTETADPGDPNEVTTTYSDFDAFGHPKTITTSLMGDTKKRTAKVTYLGDKGRYVETKTNLLGETTTYSWDETKSVLNSEKDYRDRITSYIYNGLGQLTETKTADGLKSATTLQWAQQGNPYHALYYKQSDASGAAPATVWYDAHGRELAKETFGLNQKKIFTQTVYKTDGKVDHVTEPTFAGDSPKAAATYGYDDYGRTTSVKTPLGTTTTFSDYGSLITKVKSPEGEKISELNSTGQLVSVKTNGKEVKYTYYASGLTKTSTPITSTSGDDKPLTMVYDLQGKRIQLVDPDAGTVESKYNGYGELQWERQQVHEKDKWIRTVNNYSDLGLLLTIARGTEKAPDPITKKIPEELENAEITSYTYDPVVKSRVKVISLKDKNNIEQNRQDFIRFDDFDRLQEQNETINGKTFTSITSYDALGRVYQQTFPSGYYTTNTYDTYSNLTEVKDNANRSIWKAIDENARGQLLHESKGNKVTTYAYDPDRYLPQSIKADGVMHCTYGFFAGNTNLEYRTDELTHQKEQLQYNDGQLRLTNWDVYKNNVLVKQNSMAYNATTGNIDSKSDLGNLVMKYGEPNPLNQPGGPYIARPNPGPHALTSIQGVPSGFPTATLGVTYTDFKKILTLDEGNKHYALTYGVDDQRRMSVYTVDGVLQKTRYYLGDYEEEADATTGKMRKIHYLSGGALLVNDNGVETLYYGYYDYQGSLLALVNSNNGAIEKYAYDPWGARRNPDDWSQKDTRTSWLNNRGYTGHEHLDAFGIINMNGRVYDPLTAMFLSPDPYVQAPDNWLNYNRYGYCYGNPFKYTDPSGEFFWAALPIIAKIGIAIAAGAGAYSGYQIGKANNASGLEMAGYVLGGAAIGGFSGYLGVTIAAGGGFMANTSAIMMSSYTNSMGMSALSGGQMAPSISFGVASFNFGTGEWGYLGKKGNSVLENIGYGFGALANLQDVVSALRGGGQNIDINSKHIPDEDGDIWGHSSATYKTTVKEGETEVTKVITLVSVGPDTRVETTDALGNKLSVSQTYKNSIKGADVNWHTYFGEKGTWSVRLNNVSTNAMSKYASVVTRWDLFLNSCVGHTTKALWAAGVPTIYAFHPHMLNLQLIIRQLGIYSSPYLYQIPK